jgi:hypothetical protein
VNAGCLKPSPSVLVRSDQEVVMNPFDYFERFSSSIEHYPILALLIAGIGGLLSIST